MSRNILAFLRPIVNLIDRPFSRVIFYHGNNAMNYRLPIFFNLCSKNVGFIKHCIINCDSVCRVLPERKNEVTRQLAEVQVKLYTLKNKLWYGVGQGDSPISWGGNQIFFSTSRSASPQK